MQNPLFRKVDCVMLRVADLDAAIAFYAQALGHPVLWRTAEAAGLGMPETDAEIVLHTNLGPEVDLLVECVEAALPRVIEAGGEVVGGPFDIAIGRCAIVRDPFGNSIVMLDRTKGTLVTDAVGRVVGIEKR